MLIARGSSRDSRLFLETLYFRQISAMTYPDVNAAADQPVEYPGTWNLPDPMIGMLTPTVLPAVVAVVNAVPLEGTAAKVLCTFTPKQSCTFAVLNPVNRTICAPTDEAFDPAPPVEFGQSMD